MRRFRSSEAWRVISFVMVLHLASLLCCNSAAPPEESAEFASAMNRGKAYLENSDSSLAIQAFERAVALAPDSAPALRNLARAQLAAHALHPLAATLERVRRLDPDSAATLYLSGLEHARIGQFEKAAAYFEGAVRLDPHTATLRFQLASAYAASKRHDMALRQFRATVDLDPFHTAAYHRLADDARDAGNTEELKRLSTEIRRLETLFGEQNSSAGQLEACVYTQPETVVAHTTDARANRRAVDVRFRDVTHEMIPGEFERSAPIVAATVLDMDESGNYTLFVASAGGEASLLSHTEDGALRLIPLALELDESMLSSRHLIGLSGSFQSSGALETPEYPAPQVLSDLLLLGDGGAQLFERTGPRAFEDVTTQTGLLGLAGKSARWVDYDHDGDIDLLVGSESGLKLWQNGVDGRFEDVTRRVGVSTTEPVSDVAAADLDENVAVDLVIAHGTQPTRVLENQRTGRFAEQSEPPGPWPAARSVLIDDLDNDGHVDAVLIGEEALTIVPGRGGTRHRIDFTGLDFTGPDFRMAQLIDFDNDGWLDLLLVGSDGTDSDASRLMLFRNDGPKGWHDASRETGLDSIHLPELRQIVVADMDADGDSDLLLASATGLRMLRNDGGNANGQLKIRLVGTKTNPSGIGTRVEVRAGTFLAVRSVSQLPLEIGLAANRQLDSIQTVWTNGVVENEVQVEASSEPLAIVEKMVAAGSCPFLYAWNGRRFRFVTDLLGNSPLGLSLRRGVTLAADPDEFARIGGSTDFSPREGQYVVEVTDELREVVYLDQARLVFVDHDSGVEVHPTDRLKPPPFAPSELWALSSPRVPISAMGSDGLDRTRAVSAIDGKFAPPGRPLAKNLRGQTEPLTLTLDFGPLDATRAPVLALTGWLQYGDASTNIALSQGASGIVVPTVLEMELQDGRWQSVDVTVGRPAGKTKTIVIDLAGKLAPTARRLRLRTSFELRWDRIALCERLAASALEVHSVQPTSAQLGPRGFSEIRARAPGHPTTPDWYAVSKRPPWRTTPEGWVTRFGDIRPLILHRDAKLALLNGGDALELRFEASDLPPLEPGRKRTFFFYSVGWDKDSDYNVVSGNTVEPLPVIAEDDAWRVLYNTRWIPRDWPTSAP